MNDIKVGDYVRGVGKYDWLLKAEVVGFEYSNNKPYATILINECSEDSVRQVGYYWAVEKECLRLCNDFIKHDLMFGDVVTYRCGQKAVCNGIRLIDECYTKVEDTYCSFDAFEEDLSCSINHSYDIVKVERKGHIIYKYALEEELEGEDGREEVKELTVKEISDLLGYEVKIVKEEN